LTSNPISIGYSPCPNDTYIFYALAHGLINTPLVLAEPLLADVEELNRRAMREDLDVTKLSFHALGHLLDHYVLLSAGAALGRGCGPLLVSRDQDFVPHRGARIAIPGKYTTAALLLGLYLSGGAQTVVMRFDRIMAAVAGGEVDAGVIIHEGRFTYREQGLACLQDLGQWWEEETGFPIPLGCIAAHRRLGRDIIREINRAIRASLLWLRDHPGAGQPYIRYHAQEMDEKVLDSHIQLYVNDFSVDLGKEGIGAVQELLRRGRERGLFSGDRELTWVRK
jgi:1,4-dihydroxy-6-naphthoate synthase